MHINTATIIEILLTVLYPPERIVDRTCGNFCVTAAMYCRLSFKATSSCDVAHFFAYFFEILTVIGVQASAAQTFRLKSYLTNLACRLHRAAACDIGVLDVSSPS
jgi:hypothetical protein